jgi:hypothetical protein
MQNTGHVLGKVIGDVNKAEVTRASRVAECTGTGLRGVRPIFRSGVRNLE